MGSKSTFSQGQAPPPERGPRPHSLVGPVALITLGVIFLLGQFVPGWEIGRTWPVLLVAIGVTKLLEAIFPRTTSHAREAARPASHGEKSL